MKRIIYYGVYCVGFLLAGVCLSPAWADVTNNVMSVAANVASLAMGICVILGVAMVGGAFIQYKQHKQNRLQVPISRPIVLFILGLVVLCMPLLNKITAGGKMISAIS